MLLQFAKKAMLCRVLWIEMFSFYKWLEGSGWGILSLSKKLVLYSKSGNAIPLRGTVWERVTQLWEDNTKEAGGQAEVTFYFFSLWFPKEKHLDWAPPCNSGFGWVTVGLFASCSHPSRVCSIQLLQGSSWEARGTWVCRITCRWPGNLITKAFPVSHKKLSYLWG